MPSVSATVFDVSTRRRARRFTYWNGWLWSIGNGMAGTTLIIYLAIELHAPRVGLSIGLILAARHFIGVLRLATPTLLDFFGDRKRFCTVTFALSGMLLLSLSLFAAPLGCLSASTILAAIVTLWCLHHLMQYLGMIAFYSWLADLTPLRIRGRFFGIRERWLVAGEAVGAIACGNFADSWRYLYPKSFGWIGYALPAAMGAIFMLAAIVPVLLMPSIENRPSSTKPFGWKRLATPFVDRAFLGLLFFGCWFSFSNGLTQTLQTSFPKTVLNVGLFLMLAVQTGMRLGQIGISPYLGKAIDRFGNKPVMLLCLLITAQGPLFYFFSTPANCWWFIGAWAAWIAYAGINIGLPNLTLKIAPRDENANYMAIYFTLTGLCYAGSTLLSGGLYDWFGKASWTLNGISWNFSQSMFLLGWIARLVGLVFLLTIIEPAPSRSTTRS